jgi:hypothetical protein
VTSVDAKKTLGTGLLRGWAGDTVPDFNGLFADLFFYEVPFDDECLSDMVEIEILVESTHPTEDCPGCDGQNRYKWMTSTPRPVPTASK